MHVLTYAICRNRYFQCNSLSASCSWRENGVVCIFNHTGILGISPSPSERGCYQYQRHALGIVSRFGTATRETTRTTTTNNNKLARYKVCRTLSVATYVSTYPRPAFPTLSPAHLQLSRRFIAVTVSILPL